MCADPIGPELHAVVAANEAVAYDLSPRKRERAMWAAVAHRDRNACLRSPQHDVDVEKLAGERRPADFFGATSSVPAVADQRGGVIGEAARVMRLHGGVDRVFARMWQLGVRQFNCGR